jgi:predicted amidohydrolase
MPLVAACQLRLNVDKPWECSQSATQAIRTAIANGAELIVLPELSNSGYNFASMREVQESATTLQSELILEWSQIAFTHHVVIVAGINLFESGHYWNASVIIDESGVRGWYAKTHLFGDESQFFKAGDSAPLVINTALGRIATMVCYDIEFPEWVRIAMLNGAQLLALPTNWPWIGQTPTRPPMEVVRVQAAASQNKLIIVAADRCGSERGMSWVATSVITSDEGVIAAIADPFKDDGEEIVYAQVELPIDTAITAQNDIRKDRRPNLYSLILNQ